MQDDEKTFDLDRAEEDLDVTMASSVPDSELTGELVGHYRITGEIGRGGQGVVYAAEDQKLHRQVAVKILSKAAALSPHARRRFYREATAAAGLDHVGICSIVEVGEHEGVPFIVMPLLAGRDLRDVIKLSGFAGGNSELTSFSAATEEGPEADGPISSSSPSGASLDRDSIRATCVIFEKVALAIHHAHERGLVHRDIKPSNVIVDDDGEPVLLDFGLVLNQESVEDSLSEEGALVGTPAYMSPEQLLGRHDRIDRRTDIWSMGVSLFECLCLQRPFVALTRHALFRRIAEGEAPQANRVNRSIPRDLSVIIEVAMEKDPDRRYGTALAFAEDIRRFLNHETILARPAGIVLRFTRWVQRNRAAAVATLLIFVVLTSALIVVNGSRKKAEVSQKQAEDSEKVAVENLEDARAARARAEQAEVDLKDALSRAEALLETAEDARENAEDEKELAVAVSGFLNNDILSQVAPGEGGRNMTVLELFERAADRVDGRFDDFPTIEASLRRTLGSAFQRLGRFAEATENYRRCYELNLQERGAESTHTITAANNYAHQLQLSSKFSESIKLYEATLKIARRVLDEGHVHTQTILSNLASLHRRMGRWELSYNMHRELLDRQTKTLREDHPRRVVTLSSLALACYKLQDYDESVRLNREALRFRIEALGDDHPDTLRSRNNLGMAIWRQGNPQAALPIITEVLRQRKRVLGEKHPSTLSSMNNAGILNTKYGVVEDAVALLRETLRLRNEVLGKRHGDTLTTKINLAHAVQAAGGLKEALILLEESVKDLKAVLGEHHPQVATAVASLERLKKRIWASYFLGVRRAALFSKLNGIMVGPMLLLMIFAPNYATFSYSMLGLIMVMGIAAMGGLIKSAEVLNRRQS